MKFKIPTILGLSLIITSISLSLILFSLNKQRLTQLKNTSTPRDILVINLKDTAATITWQTDLPTPGTILLSDSNSPRTDDRDLDTPTPRTIHFVTLKNLTPSTKYSYKIKDGNFNYPDYFLEFKTPPTPTSNLQPPASSQKSSFIRGTILNTNLNPIDEALVLLKIAGAQDVGGITGTFGNYIIPLGNLLNADLTSQFNISTQTEASLVIQKSSLSSKIDLTLPLKDQNLPPLTIGQNLNLDDLLASPSALNNSNALQQVNLNIYDLNKDGAVNALDTAIITDNINRKRYVKSSDLNNDSKVNQQDLDQILQALK